MQNTLVCLLIICYLVLDSIEKEKFSVQEKCSSGGLDLGWVPAFPHVLIASMYNLVFGYHIGLVPCFSVSLWNGTLIKRNSTQLLN